MDRLRLLIQGALRYVDRRYHRLHDLRDVGPVLHVGRERHRGPAIHFPDRTVLEAGDAVGTLHFSNDRFTRIDGKSARRAALGFARLMMQSLDELARLTLQDPAFRDVAVFHGVSWLPAHGSRVGFVCAPYPDGLKKRWMRWHFKLLIWAFAPARDSRMAWPDPHHFWLTRTELLQRFPGTGKQPHETGQPNLLDADARPA